MIPQDLHYDFGTASYLIFVCFLILGLFWYLFLYRKKALANFAANENLKKLMNARKKNIYFAKVLIFCLAWTLATIALMQPKGNGYYPKGVEELKKTTPQKKAHDLIFLVDASASMGVQDVLSGKSRLDFAKEIADEIISELTGEAAALYAFTSEAVKMSPVTLDLFFVRMMLRGLSINEGNTAGTDFFTTLESISKKYFKPSLSKLTTLLILSDGGDTLLETLQGEDRQLRIDQMVNLLGDPKALNLRVFTIGIGSKEPQIVPDVQYKGANVYSKLEEELLKDLSDKGRGAYYEANHLTAIEIAKNIFEKMAEDPPFLEDQAPAFSPKDLLLYQQFYQIPLVLALLLLSFYLLFPNVSIFRSSLILLVLSLDLNANDLSLAANYFEAEDFSKSQSIYEGMLQTKLDNYEKSVVQYNLGTSLLFQNEFKKAIDAFESISLKGNLPPFLTKSIYLNQSIAKFRLSLDYLSDLSQSSDRDEPLLEKIVYLLKGSQEDLMAAKNAECELQSIKGQAPCAIPPDLNELSSAINEQLKQLSTKINIDAIYSSSNDNINSQTLAYFRKKIEKIEADAAALKPTTLKELNALLEKAIEAQHETWGLTKNVNRLKDPPKEAQEMIKMAQEKTLQIANQYLNSSYDISRELYKTKGCQKKPWNEIMPLYNKGYEAAHKALKLLSKNLTLASSKQEEAINEWKKILSRSEDKDKMPNQPQENKTQENKQSKSENALQLLQEMQNSDRKTGKKQLISYPQVERPW